MKQCEEIRAEIIKNWLEEGQMPKKLEINRISICQIGSHPVRNDD